MSVHPQATVLKKSSGDDILRIDDVCDRYERALRSGDRPNLTEALQGFDNESRTALLGELFLLEFQHVQESCAPGTEILQRLRKSHPELTDELHDAVDLIKHRMGLDASQFSHTAPYARPQLLSAQLVGSRSLDVPCPNCSELCTVAADSDSTIVTCSLCGSSFNLSNSTDKTEDASALTTIGHFKLTTRLGVGGCGTVWKAYDSQLDRTVAIKIPRAGDLDPEEAERFRREAQAVARLKHSNIVSIHELGTEGDLLYFVCDYIRGVALDSWLKEKTLAFDQAAELTGKLADALHYAHGQGVIHRDVKPSNVLLDACYEPHLTDFGLAMLNRPDISHELDGFLGTPSYMAPEQAAGEAYRCDARTDVYGLGMILFQMLTGELPFRGNRDMLLYQIQFEEPISPRKLNGPIPKDLETICLKCLQKPMAARYESAQALGDDLRCFLSGKPISARPVSLPVRAWRWCLRNRAAATALAMLLLICLAGPLAAMYQSSLRGRAEQAEQQVRDFYKEYIALGIVPGPPSSEADQSTTAKTTIAVSHQLSESALQHARTRLGLLDPDNADRDAAAYLHLSAGLLAGTNGKSREAIRQFELAAETLRELHAQAPNELRYEAALAFCELRLTRYYSALEHYRASALTHRKAADMTAAWKSLVEGDPKNFWYQNCYAEAQLWLSLALGEQTEALNTAKGALGTVKEIESRWPDDAKQLYRIACELAKSQPILAPQEEMIPTLR